MTIIERLKELAGNYEKGPSENLLEHAERIRAENEWLRDTLPVLLETVEALERTTRSLAAYLDYAPESMAEKTYAPYEAYSKARRAIAKLKAETRPGP